MKNFILALSFLFLPLWASAQGDLASQLKETRELADHWLKLQDLGTTQRDLYEGQTERSELIISGIPRFIKEIGHEGKIFRHYIGKNMPIILETGMLKTGFTPYVVVKPGFSREVYEDLIGIFLTTPQTPPHEVGLPRNSNADYIDIELFPGTPLFEIEPAILLIPGNTDYPEWVKKIYAVYKRTGEVSTMYRSLVQKIDARGGMKPVTFMKIKIKKYRMNGVEVTL